jgi:hypothetical protein
MANFIDIKDFDGALTNADLEDLPDNVAQEIKNLKIEAGRLKKTFGAGTPSGTPTIGLSFVNTTTGKTYTVYNVYTFISDKFSGNSNDAGDGYRYILVTINEDKKVKLWWYDPSLPDVDDHLQVENNIMWFKTESAHGFVEDDYVLVQECKNNASPQASITGAGVYERADHIPSTTKIGVNTDNARAWGGGNFFETTLIGGASTKDWGGKHATHVLVDDNVDFDNTDWGSVQKIAIAPMSSSIGRVLSIAQKGTELAYCSTDSDYKDLSATNYNAYKAKSNFAICGLIGFNEGIYVHFTYTDSGSHNKLVKYTCSSSGSVSEGTPITLSTSALSSESIMTIANGNLYFIAKGLNILYKLTTSDSASVIATSGITLANAKGITSIDQTNNLNADGTSSVSEVNHEYLTIVTEDGSNNINHYTLDILSGGTSWTTWGTTITGEVFGLTKMDFGENSNKSESLVLWYTRSGDTYLFYSTHNSTTIINDISTSVDSTKFGTGANIAFIDKAYNIPSGVKYLIVGTDNVGSPASSGILYRVSSSRGVEEMCNPGTLTGKTNWNPTCFADCVTPQNFFTHAKAWIGVYGTEAQDETGGDSADVYKMSDIGWYANTWNGSGDCDYRWIDLESVYSISEVDTGNTTTTPTIYHNNDRNPVIPSGDTIRFVPGAVGKISNTETKGIWLGYINRSLLNNTVSASPSWYLYANKLNNPFTFTGTKLYNTGESIRPGNSVKYNLTAVYDGVQESLFDKDKELIMSDTNINNNIIELSIEFDANALNKRITGINIYRATEFSQTTSFDGYSNYQMIGHMTFVDSQTAIPTTTSDTVARLHIWRKDMVFIKSTDDLTSYDGETAGINEYALSVDGGWDGIDAMTEWSGPGTDTSTNLSFRFLVFHSKMVRAMNSTQEFMIVSALQKDNLLGNNDKCQIEDEAVIIDGSGVSSTDEQTGFTATVSAGLEAQTFTMSSAPEGYFVAGDHIKTTSIGTTTHWVVNTVSSGGGVTLTATVADGGTYSGPAGNIRMKQPVSGVMVGISRGQLPLSHDSDPSPSVLTTATTHAINSYLYIRSNSLPRSYSKANLDSNASMNDSYLDNNSMVGSDWKIEQRSWGQYSAVKEGTSGGAYGGPRIGFLYFPNPDDITGTLGTDTTGNELTVGSLAGSILVCPGDISFEIENNSAYQSTLGGCWVRLHKDHNTFGVDSDANDESDEGHFKENVQVISGFRRTDAQGSTTPGMGFEVVSGTTVKIVCQDFRLEDLGEANIQTVYSNRVNGQFAVKLKGRMFLGNLILNPEDKQEEHEDWIGYSELNQYDNRPVSNVITLDDREGGAVSGLAVLFGRLIVFKPQAIFILNVTDPANPNTWNVTESKHSVGNIAPEGVVEVHDSVYFVFHDGIYAVTSNMVADSTATPSVMEKITLPIEDQFNSANSKKDIKGIYNQKDSEILYTWQTGSPASQIVWAYHVVLKTWRKVDTSTNLDILAYGENSYPIAWDNTDTDVKKFDVDEAVGTAWKSKKFRLDLDNKRLLRYGMVQFTGTDTLTVNIYLDGSGSASFTKTITADGGVNRFPIKRYGKNFEIELTTPSSTNAFSVERMRIETE